MDFGVVKMGILIPFTIPETIWIGKYEYRLIKAGIDGKRFDLNYRIKYPLTSYSREFEINISFEAYSSMLHDDNVEDEFIKRLAILGGTIEEPHD